MEPRQRVRLSIATYHLAEQYHLGLPSALYNMQPWWIRFYQIIGRVLLGTVICAVLFLVVVVALSFYQYLVVFGGQVPDLQERLILSLPGTFIGVFGCIGCMVIRSMIAQRVPVSLLVCTEGLLEIRPQQVDVTRWEEVRGFLQGPKLGKKKRYQLNRINRKPLLFGETFESIEELANLVRQYTQKD